MENYDDLMAAVEASNGVLEVDMKTLKKINGIPWLGSKLAASIGKSLNDNGFGYFPTKLPSRQDETVRIYCLTSNLAPYVSAIQDPNERGDELLRNLASGDLVVLAQIRELVGA